MVSANQTPTIVTITSPGPQGPQGPAGPPGGATTGSNTFTGNQTITGSILISGSIIPAVGVGQTTSSFDLGSSTAAWKDIYVSEGSIKFIQSGSPSITLSAKDGGISVNGGSTISADGVSGQFITSKSLDTNITVKDSNNSLLMGPIDIETDTEIVVEEGSDLTIFGDIEIQNTETADAALFANSSSFATSASYADSSSYAVSASFVNSSSYAVSASYATNATNADIATTATTATTSTTSTSASYADTASYAFTSSYYNNGFTEIYDDSGTTYINSSRLNITTSIALAFNSDNNIQFNSNTDFNQAIFSKNLNTSGGLFSVAPINRTPTHTPAEGTILPMVSGSLYRIYVYLGGSWRSASLS